MHEENLYLRALTLEYIAEYIEGSTSLYGRLIYRTRTFAQ